MELTISQALRRRSKLKGELKEYLERAQASVTYQAPEPPAFSFTDSVDNADKARAELVAIETALRVTNALTSIQFDGKSMTLAEATCRLREEKGTIAWLKELKVLPQSERKQLEQVWTGREHVMAERHFKCDLPEAKRAETVRKHQKLFDDLNDVVESANHRTLLIEKF